MEVFSTPPFHLNCRIWIKIKTSLIYSVHFGYCPLKPRRKAFINPLKWLWYLNFFQLHPTVFQLEFKISRGNGSQTWVCSLLDKHNVSGPLLRTTLSRSHISSTQVLTSSLSKMQMGSMQVCSLQIYPLLKRSMVSLVYAFATIPNLGLLHGN